MSLTKFSFKLWTQFTLSVFNCRAPVFRPGYVSVLSARMMEDCAIKQSRVTSDGCQCTSKKFGNPSAQLHLTKVKDTVWYRVGIDLIGPLPETSRGNQAELRILDQLYRHVDSASVRNGTICVVSFVSGAGFREEHYQKLANRISYQLGMFRRGGGGGVYICELEGRPFPRSVQIRCDTDHVTDCF